MFDQSNIRIIASRAGCLVDPEDHDETITALIEALHTLETAGSPGELQQLSADLAAELDPEGANEALAMTVALIGYFAHHPKTVDEDHNDRALLTAASGYAWGEGLPPKISRWLDGRVQLAVRPT
jgi:hypothetical protein